MEPLTKLYLGRARNELVLSDMLFKISSNSNLRVKTLKIVQEMTFYSAVIIHSYYSIFYCAKAYLLSKKIKTDKPFVHQKTYNHFKKFVQNEVLGGELMPIYDDASVKAQSLLGIFWRGKKKKKNLPMKSFLKQIRIIH